MTSKKPHSDPVSQALRSNLRKRKQQQLGRKESNSPDKQTQEEVKMISNIEEKLVIQGGNKLSGNVTIQGAKNAALPIMAAGILTQSSLNLTNVPNLSDIHITKSILEELNAKVEYNPEQGTMSIDGSSIKASEISYKLASRLRASVLVTGPLLARFGEAKVPLPGGCSIGSRPVNLHLKALEAMGAEIEISHGNIIAKAPNGRLTGAVINFDVVSVGATETAMMAAVLAKGLVKIVNAAREPEIVDLADALIAMGAKITGAGTSVIEIEGVEVLHSAKHAVVADRIEAGSYALAALATKGNVTLDNVSHDIFGDFLKYLESVGASVNWKTDKSLEIKYIQNLKCCDIVSKPFPEFPTDLQSLWMSLMTVCKGKTIIEETIFENRFSTAYELIRMGADISIKDAHTAVVKGVEKLQSAEVKSSDLRSAFALIIAGLVAEGTTEVLELQHLDRGYHNVVENLSNLGASIKRLEI